MSAADELRALTDAATPGPWDGHRHTIFEPIDNTPDGEAGAEVADVDHPEDLELIVWLVNHAQAIADLIEYADDAVRFEHSPSHMGALADALTALGADR